MADKDIIVDIIGRTILYVLVVLSTIGALVGILSSIGVL